MTLSKLLNDWKYSVQVGSKQFNSVQDAESALNSVSDDMHIILRVSSEIENNAITASLTATEEQQYRITVKKYMTLTATPDFDFMAKWNDDNPMPMRTMVGTIEKETRGMVYMKLHGQAEPVVRCMRCGRLLTNPVSKLYGIGPECIEKLGFVRVDMEDVETIKQKLVDVSWEGWIIKSAITEKEPL